MFYRHHVDKLIFPFLAIVFLLILSYQPNYHLRSTMPVEFYPGAVPNEAPIPDKDGRIAWAYWESAQMSVQWKYGHAHPLPSNPPSEFHVDIPILGPAASDPAVRLFYWHRLRLVWNSPSVWQKDYAWNFGWIRDPLDSIGEWIRDSVRRSSS